MIRRIVKLIKITNKEEFAVVGKLLGLISKNEFAGLLEGGVTTFMLNALTRRRGINAKDVLEIDEDIAGDRLVMTDSKFDHKKLFISQPLGMISMYWPDGNEGQIETEDNTGYYLLKNIEIEE